MRAPRARTRARAFRPPPPTCPVRAIYHYRDDQTGEERTRTIQCERVPTDSRPPWHPPPHRCEVGEPVLSFDGEMQAQVVSWTT